MPSGSISVSFLVVQVATSSSVPLVCLCSSEGAFCGICRSRFFVDGFALAGLQFAVVFPSVFVCRLRCDFPSIPPLFKGAHRSLHDSWAFPSALWRYTPLFIDVFRKLKTYANAAAGTGFPRIPRTLRPFAVGLLGFIPTCLAND